MYILNYIRLYDKFCAYYFTDYHYLFFLLVSVLELVGNWLLTIGYRLPSLPSWQTKAPSSLKNLSPFPTVIGGFYVLKEKKTKKKKNKQKKQNNNNNNNKKKHA